jgi:hypothetical protein
LEIAGQGHLCGTARLRADRQSLITPHFPRESSKPATGVKGLDMKTPPPVERKGRQSGDDQSQ